MMTIYEFAEGLDGRQYGKEIYPFEEQRAKELGFVVVFGYSDDNAELRGAIDDEVGCFAGGRVYEDGEKYIDAVWCEGEYAWTYKTNIPHATFEIYEGSESYCKGIVFEEGGCDSAVLSCTTADVVEVVRCKYCKYWKDTSLDTLTEAHWGECRKPLGDYRYCETAENDFCSYGERREE